MPDGAYQGPILPEKDRQAMETKPRKIASEGNKQGKEKAMLYTIVGILLVLWLLGFSMHLGGGLIHTLLVIAAVVFLFNLISGRRSAI